MAPSEGVKNLNVRPGQSSRPTQKSTLHRYTSAAALAVATALGCGSSTPTGMEEANPPGSLTATDCKDNQRFFEGTCYTTTPYEVCNNNAECAAISKEVKKDHPLCIEGICAPVECLGNPCKDVKDSPNCGTSYNSQSGTVEVVCYDGSNNSSHCGGIDSECNTDLGDVCSHFACSPSYCSEDKTGCPQDLQCTTNGECKDLFNDVNNCGLDGNTCGTGMICLQGHCGHDDEFNDLMNDAGTNNTTPVSDAAVE